MIRSFKCDLFADHCHQQHDPLIMLFECLHALSAMFLACYRNAQGDELTDSDSPNTLHSTPWGVLHPVTVTWRKSTSPRSPQRYIQCPKTEGHGFDVNCSEMKCEKLQVR